MRRTALLAIVASLTLLAAKNHAPSDPGMGLITGTNDMQIERCTYADAMDNSVNSNNTYLICKVKFTNDLVSPQIIPQLERFVFLTQVDQISIPAMQGGSAVTIGLPANDFSPLPRGQTREFTLAFRIPLNQTGSLFYDLSQ